MTYPLSLSLSNLSYRECLVAIDLDPLELHRLKSDFVLYYIFHMHFISPTSIMLSSFKSLIADTHVYIIVYFVTLLYFVYEKIPIIIIIIIIATITSVYAILSLFLTVIILYNVELHLTNANERYWIFSWYAFLIFLIYVGGILVIFAYFTAS